jgi:hypothetical protein
MPLYATPMFGVITDIFFTVDSSIRVDRSFFSVASTTPLVACHIRCHIQMTVTDLSESCLQAWTLMNLVTHANSKSKDTQLLDIDHLKGFSRTLIPKEVDPAATALRAYSICTSFPLGLNVVRENEYCSNKSIVVFIMLVHEDKQMLYQDLAPCVATSTGLSCSPSSA